MKVGIIVGVIVVAACTIWLIIGLFGGTEVAEPVVPADFGAIENPGPSPSRDQLQQLRTTEGLVSVPAIAELSVAEVMSPGRYQLQAADADEFFPDFSITFNESNDSFAISLNREPISETRVAAEQFLLNTLALGEQELCTINSYIGVAVDINPFFSGQNLGFSFCPGSVSLE